MSNYKFKIFSTVIPQMPFTIGEGRDGTERKGWEEKTGRREEGRGGRNGEDGDTRGNWPTQ